MNNAYIKNIIDTYLKFFPQEVDDLNILLTQLKGEESVTSRKNFFGHITASGIVIHNNKILLIFHNKFKKYIQPGGHLEDDATLLEAAQREVVEETGIEVVPHNWHMQNGGIPIRFNTHAIPYNEAKNEPEHLHHDAVFVFYTTGSEVTLQVSEVSDHKWLPVDSLFDEKFMNDTCQKIIAMKLNVF